tara:strand:- start:2275 stop:6327 length:4053 start_codon:yes stop_codon:yes gene_type:complete
MPDEKKKPIFDFSGGAITGAGVTTNEPPVFDFSKGGITGAGVTTNQPTREQIIREHLRPREELRGLSNAELDLTIKSAPEPSKPKPRYPATLKPGPSALTGAGRSIWATLFGDKRSAKTWEEKSSHEKRGAMGTAVRQATGVPLAPEDQQEMVEELVRAGGGMAGAVHGFKYGMKTGDPRKAMLGGMLGSTLGYSATQLAQTGTPPTSGVQVRELMYGAVPGAIKPGIGVLKGAKQMAGSLTLINESAQQSQAIIDDGHRLSLSPVDVIERNLIAAGLGSALGGVAGKRIKGEFSPEVKGALEKLEARVARHERRVRQGKPGSPQTKGSKRDKKTLAEARSDLAWFLDSYPGLLDPSKRAHQAYTSAQAVRVSQVLRHGEGYDAGRDLDATYRLFDPPVKEPKTARQHIKGALDKVRTEMVSKFRPLESVEEEIRKAYRLVKPKQDLAAKFEMLPGSYAKADLDIRNFDTAVTDQIHSLAPRKWHGMRGKGAKEEARADFDVYMFLRRTKQRLEFGQGIRDDIKRIEDEIKLARKTPAGERVGEEVKYLKELQADLKKLKGKSQKKVEGYDMERVNSELDEFKVRMGDERNTKIQELADAFQMEADKALKLQVESGRMSQETYDLIKKENDFYAPFSLQKYSGAIESKISAGGAIDTQDEFTKAIKGIDDEFKLDGIVERMRGMIFQSRILAEKNMRMRDFKRVADLDTEGTYIKRLADGAKPARGKNVVTVLEDGKPIHYQVSEDVAAPIQNLGKNADVFGRALLEATSTPFKYGATALNVKFQAKNLLLADFPRAALVSHYGIQNPKDAFVFGAEYVHSLYSSALGQVTKGNKLYQDALEAGVLRSSLQQMITPDAVQSYREIGKGAGVLNNASKIGNAIEESFKVLGVKRAMKMHGAKSVQELLEKNPEAITEIRRYMGSPDFSRFGKSMEAANLLFMFANARVQGTLSDVSRLSKTGKGSKMGKLSLAVGMPTTVLFLHNQKNHAEDLQNVPQRDKDNYWIIFKSNFIESNDGKMIRDYYKIPKREAMKMFANTVEAGLDFAMRRDPEGLKGFSIKMLENVSPVSIEGRNADERMQSMFSSLNPGLRVVGNVMINPRGLEPWQHRYLMSETMSKAEPREQYHENTPKGFIHLAHAIDKSKGARETLPKWARSPVKLEALSRGFTAGLITQFMPKGERYGRSELENHPVMRALGSSFVASGYVENSKDKEVIEAIQMEAATDTVVGMRESKKFLDNHAGEKVSHAMAEAMRAYPLKNEDGTVNFDNEKMLNRIADRMIERVRGVDLQAQVIKHLPSEQRAKFIIYKLDGLDDSLVQDYVIQYIKQGLLTEDVLKHMPRETLKSMMQK